MAHDPHTSVSAGEDYREHETTYQGFVKLVKWSIIGLAVTVVLLYILIRP